MCQHGGLRHCTLCSNDVAAAPQGEERQTKLGCPAEQPGENPQIRGVGHSCPKINTPFVSYPALHSCPWLWFWGPTEVEEEGHTSSWDRTGARGGEPSCRALTWWAVMGWGALMWLWKPTCVLHHGRGCTYRACSFHVPWGHLGEHLQLCDYFRGSATLSSL